MSGEKHTPGPWTWLDYPSGAKLLVAPSRAVIHAPFPMALEPMTLSEDDARLIAAAPDLLSACQAAIAASEHITAYATDKRMTAALEQIRAAISKAEGGE